MTIGVFLGIDFLWLLVIARGFYDKQLKAFERTVNLPAALLVYVLIPLGIYWFVFPKAGMEPKQALLWGAVYGLIVYGVYDLTGLAILKNWPVTMVVVDILW